MVEESSPLLPPAEESIKAETDTAREPEPESSEPARVPTSEPGFVCDCEEWMRLACKGFPFYKEHEGRRYCVLHYPDKDKSGEFKIAVDGKLANGDFDFPGVWFPEEVDFRGIEFMSDVSFFGAWFCELARFGRATFSANADFRKARFFQDVDFSSATFTGDADFGLATFQRCGHFQHASFGKSLKFSRYSRDFSFTGGTLKAKVLGGPYASLAFDHAKVEHPSKISFESVMLDPRWFVNIDPTEFTFIDVTWRWWLDYRGFLSLHREYSIVKDIWSPTEISSLFQHTSNSLLGIVCRQLAENAEANNRYEEASRFRYWAMELARRTKWNGWSFWKTDWLHILYWAVSGYGERILRAFGVLAAVWFLFVLLYTQVGFTKPESKLETPTANPVIAAEPDTIGQPLSLKRAWIYSLAVMSLQKPEPKPLTGTAQTLVLLETILGPVQAALLALAIRRKFMR